MELGPVAIGVAPEIRISPAPVFYGSQELPENRFTTLGYLRAAVGLMSRSVTIAVSGAPRFVVGPGGVRFSSPLAAGAEFHWAIPESPVVLSALLTMEADSLNDYYFAAGGGISLMN